MNNQKQGDGSQVKNPVNNSKPNSGHTKLGNKDANEPKTLSQLCKDPNYKPKVLVRGSGSNYPADSVINESVSVSNPFDALVDEEMEQGNGIEGMSENEEFFSKVWPGLKEEVDILKEAGIYPSKPVRIY